MKRTILNYSLSAILLLITLSSSAEAVIRKESRLSVRHRSQLTLHLGVQDFSNINDEYYYYDGIRWRYDRHDPVVSFGYNYWMDELTSVGVTVKVLATESENFIGDLGLYNVDYAVVPLFFGVRRFLGPPRPSPVRPYITVMAGPVFGTEQYSLIGCDCTDDTYTQTTVGAHFGGGIEFLMGRHFTLGMNAGYNLLSDFDDPVAGHDNYSGAEFGVGFGFVF